MNGFGQGGVERPTPTHASLTPLPRERVMAARPSRLFSPRGKKGRGLLVGKRTARSLKIVRKEDSSGRGPSLPPCGSQVPKEKSQGARFGNGGVHPHTVLAEGCCRVVFAARVKFAPVVSSAPIMNESCHRRCFAWLASSALIDSRGKPGKCPPSVSSPACKPVVLSLLCCRPCLMNYFAMPGTCLEAYSLETLDSIDKSQLAQLLVLE